MFFKNSKFALLFACVFVAGFSVPSCVLDAKFRLSPESRYPGWFSIPPGKSRDDFVVELKLYAMGADKVVLLDQKGEVLKEVLVKNEPLEKPFSGVYPYFRVLSADGISEVIEHKKMEPIFYISDDRVLREKLDSR